MLRAACQADVLSFKSYRWCGCFLAEELTGRALRSELRGSGQANEIERESEYEGA